MSRAEVRAWGDLCSDLLKSIYGNLHLVHAIEFGSVCKTWHQIHAAALSHPQPRPPPPHGGVSFIDIPCWETREMLLRKQAHVVYSWPCGWWLLTSGDLNIFACFNPLLPWPSSYIPLPQAFLGQKVLEDTSRPVWPITAAFSGDPIKEEDWTMILFHNVSCFYTYRRSEGRWWSYHYKHLEGRDCVGIGHRDQTFFSLFNTGDVLVLRTDNPGYKHCKWRMMLATDTSQKLLPLWGDCLRVVLVSDGELDDRVVVSWGRTDGSSFRLLSVDRDFNNRGDETSTIVAVGGRWIQGLGPEDMWLPENRLKKVQGRPAEEELVQRSHSPKGSIFRLLCRWCARICAVRDQH
ncbi:unnamed protein product [Linum trigynum]|uniref:KIB1-4 beta-propeller domain-containing protein n=1 Tax=Linum trigynum TaxID=586398 RepID=A0AAV2DX37_9ROSI